MPDNVHHSPHNSQHSPLPDTVSVILPTRNRAKMVSAAIDSALAQRIDGMQVIVIDDASSDDTRGVLAQYGDTIDVLRIHHSRGVAHARNRGIELATGQWLAFLDSDDLWLPGKLAAQLAVVADKPAIALCVTDFAVEQQDTGGDWQKVAIYGQRPGTRNFSGLFRGNFIGTLTTILRRETCLTLGGFDESLARGSDYDLWLRVTAVEQMHRIPQVYARYRRHADSLSGLDPLRDQRTWADVTSRWIARDPSLLPRIGWSLEEWRSAAHLKSESA